MNILKAHEMRNRFNDGKFITYTVTFLIDSDCLINIATAVSRSLKKDLKKDPRQKEILLFFVKNREKLKKICK